MRIIAGKYRGRKLKSPPSQHTRPTSDRLRETLFNILAPRIEGARVLDLCAGTGAVGIEALSRAAEQVTFVDQSRKMCALIESNVAALQIDDDQVELVAADAVEFLRKRMKKAAPPFDFVFFDPPYSGDYESVLDCLGRNRQMLADDAIVVVEHYKKRALAESFGDLRRYREVKQGDSILSFFSVSGT